MKNTPFVIAPNAPHLAHLGFGCAYLTGGLESAGSVRIVKEALDAGFRHFDVAPLYGIGTAEDVLGKALAGCRHEVSIATKVGRPRPHLSLKTQIVRFLAGPVRRHAAKFLRKREVQNVQGTVSRGCFELGFVRNSLEESLRRLKTDYVDAFLLHEVMAEDLSDELLRFLEQARRDGKCRSVGLASTHEKIAEISARGLARDVDVVQYSWSVLDLEQPRLYPEAMHITHRAIMRAYEPLRELIARDAAFGKRLSDGVGCDMARPGALSNVLLGAALAHNPQGLILVGTRRIERVRENARALADGQYVEAGLRLIRLLEKEAQRPAPVG